MYYAWDAHIVSKTLMCRIFYAITQIKIVLSIMSPAVIDLIFK